jgi:hypothetical protein
MWPFKKKEAKKPEPAWQVAAIKELEDFRGMGETFNYLGRTLTVCGHYAFNGSLYTYPYTPQLKADYADNNGVIHGISFNYNELKTLKEANL